jgi:hypothetical protein
MSSSQHAQIASDSSIFFLLLDGSGHQSIFRKSISLKFSGISSFDNLLKKTKVRLSFQDVLFLFWLKDSSSPKDGFKYILFTFVKGLFDILTSRHRHSPGTKGEHFASHL